MKPKIRIASDLGNLYRIAATEFALAATEAVREKGSFSVALSGGSTPKGLYSLLASDPEFRDHIPWRKCFFFWGDERLVPPDHAESNFRMVKETLLQRVPVSASQVFRMSGELGDPSEAAHAYDQMLSAFFRLKEGEFPRFDLALLGMGSDGHTGSLFPGTTALKETQRRVVENWVGRFQSHRITMTSPVLNNSARVIFLVSGEDKALALKAVLEGPSAPQQLPAQLIRPHRGSLLWVVDQTAAKLLRNGCISGAVMTTAVAGSIEKHLGAKAEVLLAFCTPKIPKESLHLPGPDYLERVFSLSDRNNRVLVNLQRILGHGRLANTGYVSILPVDQGIEHAAGASFAKNPEYFDAENIVKLAVEAGCNAVASTFGVLGIVARRYAHRIPFIVKINHNELLTFPNKFEQILFGTVKQASDMGAAAVGATIYFGSEGATRQIVEISQAFAAAHDLGMATVLWCYLRNNAFKKDKDYHVAADLTGQANHLGASIQADIVKQKLPETNGGYQALNSGDSSYGKLDERIYTQLTSEHPIDLCRYQVANCYMGRIGLINSGGASGANDFSDAVTTAVINKRAGGMGLISGRKAFQRPLREGIELLRVIQDVYLDTKITVA